MSPPRYPAGVLVLLTLVLTLVPAGGPAFADPSDEPSPAPGVPSQSEVDAAGQAVADATARAEAVQARLTGARLRLEEVAAAAALAAEKHNEARAVLARRDAEVARTRVQAADAAAAAGTARDQVDRLAASVYMQGGSLEGLGGLEALLTGGDLAHVARQAADVESVGGHRARTLEEASRSADRAAAARRAAAQAQLRQKAAAATAARSHAAAQTAAKQAAEQEKAVVAEQERLLRQLATLRRTSVDLERRRADGLAAAEARRQVLRRVATEAPSAPTGPLPAARTDAAAKAIAFAAAQIGKPYLWGGEGPAAFDCSGLTMKAWGTAGIDIGGHYTGWQYAASRRVPISALQPGDLVFFGGSASTIHHVGLYVGDGRMIEAPRTGLDIRYSSIYRSSLLPYGGRP